VIIEPKEVPDEVLDALLEAAAPRLPGTPVGAARENWRPAPAAALTEWEKRPRDLMPLIAGHDCGWQILAVQHRGAILGIKQTDVLQRCVGCGDVRTQVLTGTWTLEQIQA